jgi:patatin-like phospholipase/acyl hydrolase
MRKILSIDGGGIRGIIPSLVLDYLERESGKSVSELFDLCVGTSSGGIIALGLSQADQVGKAKYSALDLAEFFEVSGDKIFQRTVWRNIRSAGGVLDELYSARPLEAALRKYFSDTRLGETLGSTMVPSYDIENRRTVFLKSWHPDHETIKCRDAARATSAAPTFFEPALINVDGDQRALIDGGVFVNSPVVSAYAEGLKLFPDEPLMVVSLGTGELVRPIPYESAKDWGQAGWVMPLLDCMFDGATKAANHQMQMFLGDRYIRLQVTLDEANDDMDDASDSNIANLKHIAQRLIRENESTLDRILSLAL